MVSPTLCHPTLSYSPTTNSYYTTLIHTVHCISVDLAIIAANAASQALTEVIQTAFSHKLALVSFWVEDLIWWFLHAEGKFTLARLLPNSYMCYLHVV